MANFITGSSLISKTVCKLPTVGIRNLNKRSKTATATDRRLCRNRPLAASKTTAIWFLVLAFVFLPRTLWSASACDLNSDGRVDVIDVQVGINQAFGISSCTNADLDGDGICGIVDVQRLINAALGQECLVGSGIPGSPPSPDPEPWERDFTALRTHYVSTTGTGNGNIATPESLAAAIGHVAAGDHHILRAGIYPDRRAFNRSCTAANSCRWGCFINANGDPEQCEIGVSWEVTGAWNWFWPIYQMEKNISDVRPTLQMEAQGVSVINSIFQRRSRSSCLDSFAFGSGMVIYGYTGIDCGWNQQTGDNTGPFHNLYTQNRVPPHGTKYIVQMTSLDTSIDPPSGHGRAVFHVNTSGTGEASTGHSRLSGYHVQDSTWQRGIVNWVTHTSYAGGQPSHSNILSNLWIDDIRYRANGFQVGNQGWGAVDIQDSLITRSKLSLRIRGAGDNCWAYQNPSRFLNNRIYDPYQGVYVIFETRRAASGSPCTRITGTPKIRNVDDWNNNDYRRSTAGTFSLNANGNNSTGNTFAQWKTKTSAARETAGTSYDAASTESTSLPLTDEVECFTNFYQPNWGKCRAKDWDGNGSITLPAAEVSKIIANGKTYKVRNERNFFGAALTSGTWTTGANIGPITLPGNAVGGYLFVWITSQP